ncbi:MAG: methyltransferase [Leptothrix sp. (in: b-proteobacteria)]
MPGFLTKQERVAVDGVDDLLIRSLLDREQFADPLGAAEALGISSAAWPLFGLTWPSGAQLAARLARRPVQGDERILEIGCGLALASLVGHRRGANITASDCHPLAGGFLAHNVSLNALQPLPYRQGHWGTPLLALDAGDEVGLAATRRDGTVAADSLAAVDRVRGRYDMVIGSDVLYERDTDGALAGFIDRHAKLRAEVWIVDPDRGNRAAFSRRMATLGFTLDERRLDQPAVGTLAAYKGRLLTYRRGAQNA